MDHELNLNGLNVFVENYKKRYGQEPSSNIYVLQTTDLDGNVTDEKYGVNLITDSGMMPYARSFATGFIGTGITTPSYIDDRMPDYKMQAGFTQEEGLFPITYDSTTHMISQRRKLGYVTYDYNMPDIATDITATEFGIGAYNGPPVGPLLTFHSLVYDEHGQQSSIVKHLNERLTIHVFQTTSIHEDVILDAYDDGLFAVISPSTYSMLDSYSGENVYYVSQNNVTVPQTGYNGSIYSYIEYNPSHYFDYGLNSELYNSSDRVIDRADVYEDPRRCFSYMYTREISDWGRDKYNTYSYYGRHIKMDTAEELVSDRVYTDDYSTGSIKNTFSTPIDTNTHANVLPVSDFNMTDSKMYNHNTKAWDIQDTFTNAPNAWYGNNFKNGGPGCDIYITGPDDVARMYMVYVNIHADIPITSLNLTSTAKWYATDKYWDITTWEKIEDINDIDVSLRTKHYFISADTGAWPALVPTRSQTIHTITPIASIHTITGTPAYSDVRGRLMKPLASDTYQWILSRDHICFIDTGVCTYSYELYGDTNNTPIDPITFRYNYESKIVVAPRGNYIPDNVRIYDVSTFGVNPTYTDIPISIAANVMGYYTNTVNGYIGIYNHTAKTAQVIDVTNETSFVLNDVEFFHIMDFSSYAIYKIPNSIPQQFVVYDLTTQTISATFALPSDNTLVVGVVGCSDYFYIRDYTNNAYTLFLYQISTGNLSILTEKDMPLSMGAPNVTTDINYRSPSNSSFAAYSSDGFVYGNISNQDPGYGNYAIPYVGRLGTIVFVSFTNPQNIVRAWRDGTENVGTTSLYTMLESYSATCLGYPTMAIYETPDHKHLLLTDAIFGAQESGCPRNIDRSIGVADIGYAFDTGKPLSQCKGHYPVPTRVNDSSGGLTYFDNGCIIVDGAGAITWYPLEYLLPHKVTGTTKTYQFYNNPKKLTIQSQFIRRATNRGNITRKPPASGNDVGWVGCSCISTSGYVGSVGATAYRGAHGSYILSSKINAQPGSTVTVTFTFDSAASGFTPTLVWRMIGGTDHMSDRPWFPYMNAKFMSSWLASGESYTIPANAETNQDGTVSFLIEIGDHASNSRYMTPAQFTNITVTITPPL